MPRWALGLLVLLPLAPLGCVQSYQQALGYRARQAAIRQDLDAFEGLMAEAAEDKPRSPLLKPNRTVLTHFLDMAGHERFFETIDGWRQKGWVSDNLTCSIHRARYRHTRATDPDEAQRAAGICLERARAAAYAGDRSWEVEACLEEAPFLTESSTVALAPYLDVVTEPTEPRILRRALLDGMTKLFLQDIYIRATNHPEQPRVGHRAAAEAQRAQAQARLEAILEAIRSDVDVVLVASGTAVGALELERVSLTEGRSFLWSYALSRGDPELEDLAYAWVRAAKSREKILRFDPLRIWDRVREPGTDAYWYGCLGAVEVDPIFSSARVEVKPLRATNRAPRSAVAAHCPDPDSAVLGPVPLQVTLRGSVTASVSAARGVDRVRVRMLSPKRITLSSPTELKGADSPPQ